MGWGDDPVVKSAAAGWGSKDKVLTPNAGEAFVGGNVQGIFGGFFDELAGAAGAPFVGGGVKLGKGAQDSADDTPEVRAAKQELRQMSADAPSNYRLTKNAVQEKLDAAQAANPNAFMAGRVGGTLLTAPFVAKALPAAAGAGLGGAMATGAGLGAVNAAGESRADLGQGEYGQFGKDTGTGFLLGAGGGGLGYGLSRALQGLPAFLATTGSGAGVGAVMGGAMSEEDSLGGRLKDALRGAAWGGAGSAAAYPVARAVGAVGRAGVKGAVKPTPEAEYLESQGVRLTVGQHNPKSLIGQMEEVGQNTPGGSTLRNQKEAARQDWEGAVISRGVPKEGSYLAKGSKGDRLADAYRQQNERYDSVRAAPLSARAQARPVNVGRVAKALDLAADDPSIPASPDDVATVKRFLRNQSGILQRSGASVENLMQVRANIKDARAAAEPGSPIRQLYDRAEQSITNRLQYSLPAKPLQTLRETDAGYRPYKIVEDAVAASKDATFTPQKLSTAISQNTDRGAYARGAGGELRRLAQAGHAAFDPVTPETGARVLASGKWNPIPLALAQANRSEALRNALLGRTKTQTQARALMEALGRQMPKSSPSGGRMPELLGLRREVSATFADAEKERELEDLLQQMARR